MSELSISGSQKLQEAAERIFADAIEASISKPLKRPVATYRLQLQPAFGLVEADRIINYLDELGITDVYLSPYLAARAGSTHGYDVIDHGRINPELGTEEDHERLLARLAEKGMRRVLDIVPNHMGFSTTNPMILDVLEQGPDGRFASFFDIDWHPGRRVLEGRILLPILEDFYGKVLESGVFRLLREGGQFWLVMDKVKLPLRPRSYGQVLRLHPEEFQKQFNTTDHDIEEYNSIIKSCEFFPSRWGSSDENPGDLRRETAVMKRRIDRLCERSERIRKFLDWNLSSLEGVVGEPESFDALHRLLDDQVYRLAYWRVASEEINYRRFFDVTDLAGIRVEDPEVFDYVHRLIFRWVNEGGVSALRIDHPDGLADPLGYFERLQEKLFLIEIRKTADYQSFPVVEQTVLETLLTEKYYQHRESDPRAPLMRRFPVVVEKILSSGERMPLDWPIDGTVGYKFLNALNGVFINTDAYRQVETAYLEFTGDRESPLNALRSNKVLVAGSLLSSEINNLAQLLSRVAETSRSSRDLTTNDLRRVLVEVVANFRVYRTYLRQGSTLSDQERDVIEQAVTRARRRLPTVNPSVLTFVRDVLECRIPADVALKDHRFWEAFVIRFQQTTGPIQAKGLEDTTFYRQVSLLSLNEVGGDPSEFGYSVRSFHAFNALRLANWPGGFTTTATHDTKRGEDARIRINVISELADEWTSHVSRWSTWNDSKKINLSDTICPDATEQYLFYQTLVGAWPFGEFQGEVSEDFVERIQHYLEKAASEAKRNTNWTDPDPSYKQALAQYVKEVLTGKGCRTFLEDFDQFQQRVARIAINHSLSQVVLKIASPGVVDTYQGCELWDLNLVDPDNRRPVDYPKRQQLLNSIKKALREGESRRNLSKHLYERPDEGAIKLYTTWTCLSDRKSHKQLYMEGDYRAHETTGLHKEKVISFSRSTECEHCIVVTSRLVANLMGENSLTPPLGHEIWQDTKVVLPDTLPSSWTNLLTGERVEFETEGKKAEILVGDLLKDLPVALLVNR